MAQAQQVEQPATESADVEALLDKHFGGEEPQEQPQTEQPEAPTGEEAAKTEESTEEAQPELVEIDVDGEVWQVPPKLKDRFMAQKDYTVKSTETARLKETLSLQQKEIALFQEQRAFEQSVAQDVDQLKMLDAYIQHTKANTDWSKLTTDQIVRARLEVDQLAEQRNQLAHALQAKREEFVSKLKGERNKLAESAKEVLSKAIPNWSDESRTSVHKYVQSMGYPEDALPNMSALDYQVAWKAMQYDKIKAETKTAVKKAAGAPVIAPTARKTPMPKQVRAKFDLKNALKTGKKENISGALNKRLDELFGG